LEVEIMDLTEVSKNFHWLNDAIRTGEEGHVFSFDIEKCGGVNAALLREGLVTFMEMRGAIKLQIKHQLSIFDDRVAKRLKFEEIKTFQELTRE